MSHPHIKPLSVLLTRAELFWDNELAVYLAKISASPSEARKNLFAKGEKLNEREKISFSALCAIKRDGINGTLPIDEDNLPSWVKTAIFHEDGQIKLDVKRFFQLLEEKAFIQ